MHALHSIRWSNVFEKLIPLLLFALFLSITAPGINWGNGDLWHPDELVWQVKAAIWGDYQFDEVNFDYPSLPKYTMYLWGNLVNSLGASSSEFLVAERFLSVMLGGAIVVLAYALTRRLGGNVYAGLLAACLVMSSSEMATNARFAHNDMYVTFFACLTVYLLIRYRASEGRLWLYAAFFCLGLTASSKYNGIALALAVLFAFLLTHGGLLRRNLLRTAETLFIGGMLTIAGYGLGTPKSVLWTAFYLKRVIPALQHHAIYGRTPDSAVGFLGQWGQLRHALGNPIYFFFIGAAVWFLARLALSYTGKKPADRTWTDQVSIIMVSILALDIPILLSYNYQPRFFLPMIPLLAVLAALFCAELVVTLVGWGRPFLSKAAAMLAVVAVAVTFPRVVSIALLFLNDARMEASQYVAALPAGTSIEYTLYPPTIPDQHFIREHNYPIFFKKYPGQVEPTSRIYKFNAGEAGLNDRRTDYLVIDSLTYSRFQDEYICDSNLVECRFFEKLLAGETSYQLIADFKYSLPEYLPDLQMAFLNPEIRVYVRASE